MDYTIALLGLLRWSDKSGYCDFPGDFNVYMIDGLPDDF